MAYVVNTTNTAITTSAGSTYTVTLGAHQDGDLLLICVTQASGNVEFTATGWTVVGTQNRNSASRQGWLYKVVGTGEAPVTNPAVACRVGEAILGMSVTIRKASLTPTIRWQRTDWGDFSTTYSATTNPPTASIETANAAVIAPENALLIYSVGSGSNPSLRAPANDLMELSYQTSASTGYCAQSVGYRQINAGATVPSITFKGTVAGQGNAWVLSIPDDGDGVIDRNWFSGGTEFDYYGDYGEAHFPFGTALAANNFAATINSTSTATVLTSTNIDHANTTLSSTSANGKATAIRTADNSADLWSGAVQTLNADQNMSGKIFSVHYRVNRDSDAVFGDKGICVTFADTGGDWVAYQLATNPAILSNNERTAFIEVGNATALDSSGAMDWANVDKIGWYIHRDGSDTNFTTLYIKNAQLLSTAVYTGGHSSRPLTIASGKAISESWDFYKLQGLQASAQSEVRWPIQIGDGTFKTYFKASAASTETPTARDVTTSTSQQDWNVSDDACGVTVYASANCTMDFSAALLTSATKQPFTIHASSSTSATYSFQGLTLVGWTVTWKTGIPATLPGVTFDSCYEIDMKGQDMTSCTVDNTANSAAGKAALTFTENGAVLDSCTIDGTGAAYAIELGTSVTAITLTDCTITAGTMDKVHVLKTLTTVSDGSFVVGIHYRINTAGTTNWTAIGGAPGTVGTNFTATGVGGAGTGTADQAVKITISGMTSLVETDVTTAGAPAWIAAPQPTLDATVLSGTRVVLYNNTTAAELDNTAPAGTAWSKVITGGASSNDNLTLFAFKEGYAEFSTSFLYSGSDTTILVTQVVDDVVAAFRTEDSITDYTTLTEYNIYAPTIYIQADDADGVSKISRLATYYNGILTTEDGARYFRGGMSMLSTGAVRVNKSVIELLLENVSATKSLRFSDEATRRLYTDDGTSIIAPSSVAGSIEYAYGGVPDTVETGVSGLTGPESAQLMALPSAATIVATAVDGTTTLAESLRLANAVLGGKVSGASTGTESFRDLADTKNRVVATVDSSGNRTALTRDLT